MAELSNEKRRFHYRKRYSLCTEQDLSIGAVGRRLSILNEFIERFFEFFGAIAQKADIIPKRCFCVKINACDKKTEFLNKLNKFSKVVSNS